MHEARPGTERSRVHVQYIVALDNLLKPSLDLGGLVSILFTRDLNARPGARRSSRRRDANPRHSRFRPRRQPRDVDGLGVALIRHSYRGDTSASDETARLTPAPAPSLGSVHFSSCVVGEQQRLQRRPGCALKPMPILHRHQNGSVRASLGDDLWPFLQAAFQHLAEPGLRILNWPTLHGHTSRRLSGPAFPKF